MRHRRDLSCSRPPEDGLRRCVRKLLAADGVVIGSPAYSAKCSPAAQALMVRAQAKRAGAGHPLACKVAGGVVERGSIGSAGTLRTLTEWFRAQEMIVVGRARAERARRGRGRWERRRHDSRLRPHHGLDAQAPQGLTQLPSLRGRQRGRSDPYVLGPGDPATAGPSDTRPSPASTCRGYDFPCLISPIRVAGWCIVLLVHA